MSCWKFWYFVLINLKASKDLVCVCRVVSGIGVTLIQPLYYVSMFSRDKVYGYPDDVDRYVRMRSNFYSISFILHLS